MRLNNYLRWSRYDDRRSAVVNRGFLPGLRLMSEQTDRSVIGLEVCALTVLLYRSSAGWSLSQRLFGKWRRQCRRTRAVESCRAPGTWHTGCSLQRQLWRGEGCLLLCCFVACLVDREFLEKLSLHVRIMQRLLVIRKKQAGASKNSQNPTL